MGEAGTKNPASAVQWEDRQAGVAVAAVLPVLRLEHPETLLPQRTLRKWDKTGPSRPGVADMKDIVLPFERLRATVFRETRPKKSAYLILGTPAFQLIIWGAKMHPVRDSRSLLRR